MSPKEAFISLFVKGDKNLWLTAYRAAGSWAELKGRNVPGSNLGYTSSGETQGRRGEETSVWSSLLSAINMVSSFGWFLLPLGHNHRAAKDSLCVPRVIGLLPTVSPQWLLLPYFLVTLPLCLSQLSFVSSGHLTDAPRFSELHSVELPLKWPLA